MSVSVEIEASLIAYSIGSDKLEDFAQFAEFMCPPMSFLKLTSFKKDEILLID